MTKRITAITLSLILMFGAAPLSGLVGIDLRLPAWFGSPFESKASAATGTWGGETATAFASGAGTEDDPYLIRTAAQLAFFAASQNEGINFSGEYIKLDNDIELNGADMFAHDKNGVVTGATYGKTPESWTPIGTSYSFKGTFDGDGHTVSGIYIDSANSDQGLFGWASGVIKNLGVIDSYISGDSYIGGVVGYSSGTVTHCYNTGTVERYSEDYRYGSYAGGVVGYINNGTVTNCYNTGVVYGYSYNVGGVVGYINAKDTSDEFVVIDCYNTGTVGGINDVGGVVGCVDANYTSNAVVVTDCYNTGTVGGSYNVGGVVGDNGRSAATDCYNTGTVSGRHNVGGVVGSGSTATDCYNSGTVSGTDSVGGVVGSGTATNCYSTSTVSGTDYVGGVVGSGSATNCYNTSAVSGSGDYVGGVVGGGTATDCYYLTGTAKFGIGNPSADDGAAPLTDAQMKTESSFASWDFHNVWTIDNQNGYEYPQFIKYLTTGGENAAIWDGSIAEGFASGTGTEADPYIIMTNGQLAYLAQSVNSGTSYENEFIKLAANLELNDYDAKYWTLSATHWVAIGTDTSSTSSQPFNGTFDGDGHTVSGIYIDSANDNQGLFGYATDSTIKNLGVIDSYIFGNNAVGGVVGNNSGTVTQCYNIGTVSGSNEIGGVVGNNSGTVTQCYNRGKVSGDSVVSGVVGSGTATNCYNTGTVSGRYEISGVVGCGTATNCYNTSAVSGNDYVGGVVGSGTATNCYNTSAVSGNDYVGGVVGSGRTVTDCYNTGTVSGSSIVGGVAGSGSTVTNCYYLTGTASKGVGNTSSDKNTFPLTDAQMKIESSFTGWDFHNVWAIDNQNGYEYPQFIKYLTTGGENAAIWDGSVAGGFESGTGTKADPYIIMTNEQLAYLAQSVNSGTTYSGKFIKLAANLVLNNHNAKYWILSATPWVAIGTYNSSTSSQPFKGTFDGGGHTVSGVYIDSAYDYQGLFGYATGSTIKNLGVINSQISGGAYVGGVVGGGTATNCYNTGMVSGSSYVGGVVGHNYSGTVTNCYNTGMVSGSNDLGGVVGYNDDSTVINCYNTGTVSGSSCVGGVVGLNYNGTASNCYNIGTVSGSSCVGGVVGVSNQSLVVTNSYYLTGTAEVGIGSTSFDEGVSPLTEAQMKTASSFVDWDFSTVWTMDGNPEYQYPELIVRKLEVITVKTMPINRSYIVGDALDTKGLALTATYNNSTSETVNYGFTCTPTNLNTVGTQTITVSYTEDDVTKTCTFTVNVATAAMTGITVRTMPNRASYYVGDTLDTTGLTLTATYNNSTSKTITSGIVCSPTALNTAGVQTITAFYSEGDIIKSCTFTVNVTLAIKILGAPASMKYQEQRALTTEIASSDVVVTKTEWSSSDTKIATVDQNGKVTAVGRGTATITVEVTDASGATISAQAEITCTMTFFQRLIAFFRSLFGGVNAVAAIAFKP